VVVVSADVQDSSKEMVQAAGAQGFLVKPVGRDDVLATVRGALAETP
jgi:DNA-binding NarL/FixJ family response regulator